MSAPTSRRTPAMVGLAVASMLLVVGATAVAFRFSEVPGDAIGEPRALPTTTLPEASPIGPGAVASTTAPPGPTLGAPLPELGPVTPTAATATCEAPPGVDASGERNSYEAGRAIDAAADTAWRCDGDGVGERLTVTLPARAVLGGITLIPGFAKTDAANGADRYAQGRRISAVRISFDGGTPVDLPVDPAPTRREPQQLTFPPIETATVTVEIVSSVPGTGNDLVAVSEIVPLVRSG